MEKQWGFPGFRRHAARPRLSSLPHWLLALALLAALLLIAGLTRAWSQSSGLSSQSSGSDLSTWETLSKEFRTALDGQSTRLQQALTDLETSQASSTESIRLLEQSLKANENLKSYNAEIAARMQERDEDLVLAYAKIDRLEKQNLRLIITIVILGALLAVITMLNFIGKK